MKEIVWGIPTLSLLLVSGIYFTRKSGFYRFKALKTTILDIFNSLKIKKGGISPFAAVATALGGTVGVGSIVGVGYALSVGGAGSIFWMWVCSFFGMGLKYAEVKIALGKRESVEGVLVGGAPFRLRELGFKKTAWIFCLFCVAASFGTGNLTQVGPMASFLSSAGASGVLCAAVCFSVIAVAVFGGRKRISDINAFLVPSASVLYLAACAVILLLNLSRLPSSLSLIFREAFGFSSIAGGFSGAMLSQVLREGFARSLFSNEAGMGSSPLAHATSDIQDPRVQAEWGIFEIFFDTFVVSTVTALCLLSCGLSDPARMFSESFGTAGKWLFGVLAAVFAFASVISWCYYAECCLDFMFPKSKVAKLIYRFVFASASVFGIFVSGESVWVTADILNALMMFPNLFLLFKCRKEIERMG